MKTKLASVRVLWRQSDTMSLWGIPYDLRPGQEPRHLVAATWPDVTPPGWRSCDVPPKKRAGEVPSNWLWLGNPGWNGSLSVEDVAAIKAFLAPIREADMVPTGPGEWSWVAAFARGGEA